MRPRLLLVAHFGHDAMSDLSPLYAPKQTFANASGFVGSRASVAKRLKTKWPSSSLAFVIIFAFCYHPETSVVEVGCCHSDRPWPGSGPLAQFIELSYP